MFAFFSLLEKEKERQEGMAAWKGTPAVGLFLEPTKVVSELEIQSLLVKLNSLIVKDQGNSVCADCTSTKINSISLNLGTFLCLKCALIHTETLKPHISTILPVDPERVEAAGSWIHFTGSSQIIRHMQASGNKKANSFWEAKFEDSSDAQSGTFSSSIGVFVKPDDDTEVAERKFWIRAKYLKRSFVRDPGVEAVIRLKGKVARLHATFSDTEVTFESSVDLTGKRTKIDTIPLAAGQIRPYQQNGEIENFDIHTKSLQFQVLECQDLLGFLFSAYRCGCSMVAPKQPPKAGTSVCVFFCYWLLIIGCF